MQTLTSDMTATELAAAIDHNNRIMFAELAYDAYMQTAPTPYISQGAGARQVYADPIYRR